MGVNLIGHTCIGYGHTKNGKPCQDYSRNETFGENGDCYCIVVSDGHGSDKYFRSDRGSRFAVDVAVASIKQFVEELPQGTIALDFFQKGISSEFDNTDHLERLFRHLFENICAQWHDCVLEDWNQNSPTDEEYIKADGGKGNAVKKVFDRDNPHIATAYGCTLIAAVRTPTYWFAFHLGDGKCMAFREDGTWFEPIPWDDACYENITTSLCNEGAESFRYCYGTKQIPAIFIGSDGLDDTYNPIDVLADWYRQVLYLFENRRIEDIQKEIERVLPILSQNGSHDDMSLQLWVDNTDIIEWLQKLRDIEIKEKNDQREMNQKELKYYEDRLSVYKKKVDDLTAENRKYETRKGSMSDKIEALKREIEKLETTKLSQEKEIRELENSLRKKNEEKEKLEKDLQNKKNEQKLNEDKVANYSKSLNSNESLITRNQVNIRQVEKHIEQVKGVISQIDSRIETLKKK